MADSVHVDVFNQACHRHACAMDVDDGDVTVSNWPQPLASQALHGVDIAAAFEQPSGESPESDCKITGNVCIDLGALVVCQSAWCIQNLVRSRPYEVILRHPTDSTRGVPLCGNLTSLSDAEGAASAITAQLDIAAGDLSGRVNPDVYAALGADPGLREVTAAAAAAVRPPPAAAAATEGTQRLVEPTAAAPPQPDVEISTGECPICLESLDGTCTAMRCSGAGGVHHYFHERCMVQWMEQCRVGTSATCPMCRCPVQFHAQRLEEFLQGPQSSSLASEDRGFLEACLERMRQAGSGWGDVCTAANAKCAGGIVVTGGWGFMIGYTQPPPTIQRTLALQNLSREQYIAQGVGYALGAVCRIVQEFRREQREREEREQRSPQRHGSARGSGRCR